MTTVFATTTDGAPVAAVLFDLDGTLVDSAPDLAGACNELRAARGLLPVPLEQLRPMVSMGARGMLRVGLSIDVSDPDFAASRDEFLRLYELRLTRETAVFQGMVPVLAAFKARGLPWGIVTNKAQRFTGPVVAGLPLLADAGAVVSGDTTPHAKPHPEPLLEAARRMGVPAEQCIYVGDDLRDVQAGLAAGMRTVAVRWGYLGDGGPVEAWGAHHVIERPDELLKLLSMA
jgi:2-phosphoglycolate phosphatase